jgi:hypothetical protein
MMEEGALYVEQEAAQKPGEPSKAIRQMKRSKDRKMDGPLDQPDR